MKFLIILFTAVVILWIGTAVVFAQLPGLPSAPSQAPIDGGLGLLAAAGGAYAFKRLHNKKIEKKHRNH